jgi:hypothetical protein
MGTLQIIERNFPDIHNTDFDVPPQIILRLLDSNTDPLFEFELPLNLKLFIDEFSNMSAVKCMKG